jgi:membrane dipeptidase
MTAVNVTVSAVGVLAGAFDETVKQIGYWERELEAHPDAITRIPYGPPTCAPRSPPSRLGLVYGSRPRCRYGRRDREAR